MATTESLAALNWLARSYAPALLTVLGRDTEAGQISGSVAINNTTRMNQATTRLNTLEAQCWAEYVPAWDPHWPQAQAYVFTQVVEQSTTAINLLMFDPDQDVKRCLKAGLRALEMAAFRFIANGGVLP